VIKFLLWNHNVIREIAVKDETRRALFEKAAVSPQVLADAFEISINSAYAAINAKQVPSAKVGGQHRIPSAWIRKELQLDAAAKLSTNAA
jgi:hypothetical protein